MPPVPVISTKLIAKFPLRRFMAEVAVATRRGRFRFAALQAFAQLYLDQIVGAVGVVTHTGSPLSMACRIRTARSPTCRAQSVPARSLEAPA